MNEPLLFLPGMMCDARLFFHQIVAFSTERSVHVGNISQSETIEKMAEDVLAAAPAKFALAGHSMGAIVAMEIQRRAPDRVTRLALMDTNAQPEMPSVAAAREQQIVKAKSGRLADVVREEVKPHYLAPGPQRDDMLNIIMDMAMLMGPDVYVRQSKALQKRPDQQKTLRMVRCPALVLCGVHDELTPLLRHEFISTLIPYATLEVVPDAGHLPTLESPDEVTRHLRNWLNQPLVLR